MTEREQGGQIIGGKKAPTRDETRQKGVKKCAKKTEQKCAKQEDGVGGEEICRPKLFQGSFHGNSRHSLD